MARPKYGIWVEDLAAIQAFLAHAGAPCPICARMIERLDTPACPHCHAPLALGVGSADLRRTPWIVALVAVACSVGFAAISLAVVFSVVAFRGVGISPRVVYFLMINGVGFITGLAALIHLVRARGSFLRHPPARQRRLAARYALLPTALFLAMLAFAFIR